MFFLSMPLYYTIRENFITIVVESKWTFSGMLVNFAPTTDQHDYHHIYG
jgi:hypothetical protein